MSHNTRPLTGIAAMVDPKRLDRGITQDHLDCESVRAHAIEPGDILHEFNGSTVLEVHPAPFNGQGGRRMHLVTDHGPLTLPINAPTQVSRG